MNKHDCEGCQGIQALTPAAIHNRSRLDEIGYRVGTHAAFYETMLARLSEVTSSEGEDEESLIHPLRMLTARESDDASIAMLDSWSVIADVLSFYQERIANEAYLRTANQRSSIQQLANLIGYKLRPGLSSSVYLAFTVHDRSDEVLIPAGTQAKSTPAPDSDATSQTFETRDDFVARHLWNEIRPRISKPHDLSKSQNIEHLERIYLKGTGLQLRPNDRIAIQPKKGTDTLIRRVDNAVEVNEPERQLTIVHLLTEKGPDVELLEAVEERINKHPFDDLFEDDSVPRRILGNALEVVRQETGPQQLASVDKKIQEEIVLNAIAGRGGDGDAPKGLANLYRDSFLQEWIAEKAVRFSISDQAGIYQRSIAPTISSLNAVLTNHQMAITKDNKNWGQVWDEIDNPSTLAQASVQAQTAFWKLVDKTGDDQRVGDQVYLVMQGVGAIEKADNDQLFPAPEVEYVYTGTPHPAKAFLSITTTAGIELKDSQADKLLVDGKGDEVVANRINFNVATDKNKSFVDALKRITVTKAKPGTIQVLVFETVNNKHHLLGHINQFIKTADEDLAEIKDLQPFKVHTEASSDLSKSFDITGTLDSEDETQIKIKGTVFGTIQAETAALQRDGDDWTGELETNLKDFKGKALTAKGGRSVIHVSFELFNGDERLGTVFRTLVRLSNDARYRFHRSLAQRIGRTTDGTIEEVKQEKADAVEWFNDQKAALTTASAHTLLSKLISDIPKIDSKLNPPNAPAVSDVWTRLKEASIETTEANEKVRRVKEAIKSQIGIALNELANGTEFVKAEDLESKIGEIKEALDRYPNQTDSLFGLIKQILELLLERRKKFVVDAKLADFDSDAALVERFKSYGDKLENLGKELANPEDNKGRINVIDGSDKVDAIAKFLERNNSSLADFLAGDKQTKSIRQLFSDANEPSKLDHIRLQIAKISNVINRDLPTTSTGQSRFVIDVFASNRAGAGLLAQLGKLNLETLLSDNSNLIRQAQSFLSPTDQKIIFDKMRRFRVKENEPGVYVFRSTANLFGWNSPGVLKSKTDAKAKTITTNPVKGDPVLKVPNNEWNLLHLDGEFKKTTNESLVAWMRPRTTQVGGQQEALSEAEPKPDYVTEVHHGSRTEFGVSGNSTTIRLRNNFWNEGTHEEFKTVKESRVWCDAEELELAEIPLDLIEKEPPSGNQPDTWTQQWQVLETGNQLELDEAHPEINIGTIILFEAIEFNDEVANAGTLTDKQLFEVVAVSHPLRHSADDESNITPVYGDRVRTILTLNRPIGKKYLRGSVKIYANVVEATHGGTVNEVMGNGDGRKRFQRFVLKDGPITRVPAANLYGSHDELEVRVNSVRWDAIDRIADAKVEETSYELNLTADERSEVLFGDGKNGTRLPTGNENVRGSYRVGLGFDGNVAGDRIDQLPSPPLGVQSVRNPLRATGGANKDTESQSRMRTGLATASMQKLVSLVDYRNFALFFAGVDKAKATLRSGSIDLTVAGATFEPLPEESALFRNLQESFRKYGEPGIGVRLYPHQAMLMFIFARIQIDDRFPWEMIEQRVRKALFNRFRYANAQFDTNLYAADVITTIQSVTGVVYVDLDGFDGIAPKDVGQEHVELDKRVTKTFEINVEDHNLCFLTPEIPNTLRLEQL